MDVMACKISRSGNYQLQLDDVQAIFPDREVKVTMDSKWTPSGQLLDHDGIWGWGLRRSAAKR
jgi:hypothetical protein